MRSLYFLIALMLASFSAEAQTWTTYTSEAGRFQIDMPGTPKVSTALANLKDGSTPPVTVAAVEVGGAIYVASYGDYPAKSFDGVVAARTLEQVRDGTARGHTLLRDKPIMVAGHPGREYVIARTSNYTFVIRSTLVGLRLYQLIYAAAGRTEPASPGVKRFLDSFALR